MGHIKKGDYTYGNIIRRGDMNDITIGKFCSIAINVVVDSGFNHETKWISTYPFRSNLNCDVPHNAICKGNIQIGNDVWICENVLIMSGVKIGDGAIIGANSIVTKDVEDYSIVAGSPAKEIKKRFTYTEIYYLKQIAWWNWDVEKIKENAHYLNGGSLEEFINKHKTT